jgi:hypothetical protein
MLDDEALKQLAGHLVYVGSSHHKRRPGDYGFRPPVNPRPSKSLCDGLRPILLGEARAIFRQGVLKGMFSEFWDGELPKYVWAVDDQGEAYEAKIGNGGYHGYRLTDEDDMRDFVLREWMRR